MESNENTTIKDRIEHLRSMNARSRGYAVEGIGLAQSVLYDTVGKNHPLVTVLDDVLKSRDPIETIGAIRSVVTLYDQGGLRSPRLAIAHEIEGDILNIAQKQVEAAEKSTDEIHKQIQLAISAFLAGAALEDALRRLCDARGVNYDPQRTSISKLQAALYQPAKQIEVISGSENKQITTWGDTRNKADHGRFSEITYAEVITMVIGVRAFIDKHLP